MCPQFNHTSVPHGAELGTRPNVIMVRASLGSCGTRAPEVAGLEAGLGSVQPHTRCICLSFTCVPYTFYSIVSSLPNTVIHGRSISRVSLARGFAGRTSSGLQPCRSRPYLDEGRSLTNRSLWFYGEKTEVNDGEQIG